MSALLDLVRGATFDDFLFTPQYSVLERRDPSAIDLSSKLSQHLTLKRPIVSANMDTITRAEMAIAVAEEGGIGIIDRGFRSGDVEPQVREVERVKRRQHGIIVDPYTIRPDADLNEAAEIMRRTGVGTLVVVDDARRVAGLVTTRDLRFSGGTGRVSERMTPRDRLIVREGTIDSAAAEDVMREHKIKKLPLVDGTGRLLGLITAKDLIKQKQLPAATRDSHGRLMVGAAIGAKGDYLERAAELLRAGADVIVIDIAHGHSVVMSRAVEAFRKQFGDVELIAGNVATADGVRFLIDRGVNGVKVGIGPGGGCTTRLNTNFGVPQVAALVECRTAAGGQVPLIADGGVKRDGALVQALLFGGDTVMLGGALAGTLETPGDTVQKPVVIPESHKTVKVPFKVFRGMASLQAIVDRLDVEDSSVADVEALGAEGMEISVPARGSVRPVIRDMLKHLCSAISYGGAASLAELQQKFRENPERFVIRLTESSRRESFDR
ncbi:MAG TPA: IMP dehydrogenase [Vicinamibacterales bacterium]|jgi:IMP dehydrogenase|nr:IMP dehydrogenase [Vicinamibacterales bacterium]